MHLWLRSRHFMSKEVRCISIIQNETKIALTRIKVIEFMIVSHLRTSGLSTNPKLNRSKKLSQILKFMRTRKHLTYIVPVQASSLQELPMDLGLPRFYCLGVQILWSH